MYTGGTPTWQYVGPWRSKTYGAGPMPQNQPGDQHNHWISYRLDIRQAVRAGRAVHRQPSDHVPHGRGGELLSLACRGLFARTHESRGRGNLAEPRLLLRQRLRVPGAGVAQPRHDLRALDAQLWSDGVQRHLVLPGHPDHPGRPTHRLPGRQDQSDSRQSAIPTRPPTSRPEGRSVMAKCSDEGQCYCKIHGGGIIEVDGTGTMTDPYVISTGPVGNFMTVTDTPTVDLALTGSGTGASPYNLTATAQVTLDGVDRRAGATGQGRPGARPAGGRYVCAGAANLHPGRFDHHRLWDLGRRLGGEPVGGEPAPIHQWDSMLPGINISTATSAFYCRTADNRIVQVPATAGLHLCAVHGLRAHHAADRLPESSTPRINRCGCWSPMRVRRWTPGGPPRISTPSVWGWNWGNEYYTWWVPMGTGTGTRCDLHHPGEEGRDLHDPLRLDNVGQLRWALHHAGDDPSGRIDARALHHCGDRHRRVPDRGEQSKPRRRGNQTIIGQEVPIQAVGK